MEISSPLIDMDRAQALALRGIPAENAHIELCIPTVHDPSLAPEGKHIVTIDVNSQPYNLPPTRARGTTSARRSPTGRSPSWRRTSRTSLARSSTGRCSRRSTWSG